MKKSELRRIIRKVIKEQLDPNRQPVSLIPTKTKIGVASEKPIQGPDKYFSRDTSPVRPTVEKFKNESWNESIIKLHDTENIENYKANFYQRLAYDEIFESFLVNSEIRKKIKKIKKTSKKISDNSYNQIINKLNFRLKNDQKKSLTDINKDLRSNSKMFKLLQGDVGSGKTIVALISA